MCKAGDFISINIAYAGYRDYTPHCVVGVVDADDPRKSPPLTTGEFIARILVVDPHALEYCKPFFLFRFNTYFFLFCFWEKS